MLIGATIVLFSLIVSFYYVRFLTYAVEALFGTISEKLPNVIDLAFLILMVASLGFIVYLIVRLRRIKKKLNTVANII
jgi:hypothetical protein